MIITIGEEVAYRIEDVMFVFVPENDKRCIRYLFRGGALHDFKFNSEELAHNECKKVVEFMIEADNRTSKIIAAEQKNADIKRLKEVLNTLMIDTKDKAEIIKLMEE